MAKSKYTLETKQKVLQIYKNGKSVSQIAKETGISISSIYNWARKSGIRKKEKQKNVNQIRKLNQFYEYTKQQEPLDLSWSSKKPILQTKETNYFDILEEDIFRPSIENKHPWEKILDIELDIELYIESDHDNDRLVIDESQEVNNVQ